MLLIFPPTAKPSEPPAGIARLAGFLKGHGIPCTLLDANIEGVLFLLELPVKRSDPWSKRAGQNVTTNLKALRDPQTYISADRYAKAVLELNRVVEQSGNNRLSLNLANYQDQERSPLCSADLIKAADEYSTNVYHPYFSSRLQELLAQTNPTFVGFSLNYLSQALSTFAMIGFLKKIAPKVQIIMGGGLITSWLRNPAWQNPFSGLVDLLVAGPGEAPLLALFGKTPQMHCRPEYTGLPLSHYLSPGLTLPYAASSGCYWNKCLFCPEKSEENPYQPLAVAPVRDDISSLVSQFKPTMLHFLDNAISPALMRSLIGHPPELSWYSFARINNDLLDRDFCLGLRRSGCVLLKLGIESGNQGVLDAMEKGIELSTVSQALRNLHAAGIATYVYLLFGTPSESYQEAKHTLDFAVKHHEAITFMNLAIFNMPIGSPEAKELSITDFYEADLGLYTDFNHPKGWDRVHIRKFLDHEFKRHPVLRPIILRDPPIFTSNHAPFLWGATIGH